MSRIACFVNKQVIVEESYTGIWLKTVVIISLTEIFIYFTVRCPAEVNNLLFIINSQHLPFVATYKPQSDIFYCFVVLEQGVWNNKTRSIFVKRTQLPFLERE